MIDVQTPAFRATDPETSELAAIEITASGERKRQQDATAEAVRKHPGKTSHELAQVTGLNRYALARRLPECVTGKEVVKGAARTCAVSGRKAVTWWPVQVECQQSLPLPKVA